MKKYSFGVRALPIIPVPRPLFYRREKSLHSNAIVSRSALPSGWYPYASIEDQQVPITTRAGQSQWLQNTACAFQAAGVTKQAYWTMYDPDAYWASSYYGFTGGHLAMQGFWGLVSDGVENGGTVTYKPSWTTLTSYYQGTLSCPTPAPAPTEAPPLLEVNADTTYVTIAQPVGFYLAVADETSLALPNPKEPAAFTLSISATHRPTPMCRLRPGLKPGSTRRGFPEVRCGPIPNFPSRGRCGIRKFLRQ
jgi:hypothetical protein